MDVTLSGCRVHLATGGRAPDESRPALLFLHGAGLDHTVWTLQARYFAHHGWSVLVPDLPGHGGSDGPPLGDIPAMAAWVAALAAELGRSEVALVGHSMGALVALEAAARLGPRCRALVLLGAALRMPVHPKLKAAAGAGDKAAVSMIVGWGLGAPAARGGHPVPGLWLSGAAARLLERRLGDALGSDLTACDAYDGGVAAATRVAAPTLVLSAALDRMTPAGEGQRLAGAIAGASCVELAATGHMMMMEAPDATLDALAAFLGPFGR